MKATPFKLLVFALLLNISCEKEESKEPGNHLMLDGNTYELTHGYIEYHGQWNDNPDSYNFDIRLFSTGFELDDLNNPIDGRGHYLFIELFSSSPNHLSQGDYNYDKNATYNPLTFNRADYAIYFDLSNQYGDAAEEIKGGSVSISTTDNEYEISFTLVDANQKNITGFFKGTLSFDDFSGDDLKHL